MLLVKYTKFTVPLVEFKIQFYSGFKEFSRRVHFALRSVLHVCNRMRPSGEFEKPTLERGLLAMVTAVVLEDRRRQTKFYNHIVFKLK